MGIEKKMSLIFVFLFLFSINFIYADVNLDIPLPTSLGNSYGTFKIGTDISLVQECTNKTAFCDECNITSLKYPNSSLILVEGYGGMTKLYSLFNYTFDDSLITIDGKYTVTGFCRGGEIYSPWTYSFEITPSGKSGSANIVFIVFLILMIYIITFIGFFGKNEILTIIGGMAMIFTGIYLINNGIIIYRDNLTIYFSYLTSFVGAILSLWAAISLIQGEM